MACQAENERKHSGENSESSSTLVGPSGPSTTTNCRLGHTHILREHNKEADAWADKGAKGQVDEWVDTAHVVWSEVIGLCGFWDGSCDNGKCVASTMIMACSEVLGRFPIYKKCGPVVGQNFLGAELGGCVC